MSLAETMPSTPASSNASFAADSWAVRPGSEERRVGKGGRGRGVAGGWDGGEAGRGGGGRGPGESRRVGRSGGEVVLSVADNGAGVPESERGRVLERFVRLEASRSTPGTGLGLSLAAAAAKLSQGTLELGDAEREEVEAFLHAIDEDDDVQTLYVALS